MVLGFGAAVLAVSILLLLLFAAWGRLTDPAGSRATDAARVVFTGWGGVIERDVFTRLVAEFERRNPDVDVEYRPVPRDYVVKLKLMFAGGTPPDVFYLPDGDFPGFAVAGRLENLQPYIDRSRVIRTAEIWEAALRRYRFDGRQFRRGPLYALPKDIGPTAMYVNLELLRKEGIPFPFASSREDGEITPQTWDEALKVWKRLAQDWNGDGRVDQWGTHGMTLETAVWSHGGDFLSPDGRRFTMADDPLAIEAAQWHADLQARHRVAPMDRQQRSIPVDTLFLTGRLATFIGGRWEVPKFRNAEFDWDVAPIPVSPRTRKQAGWSGSVGLAMSPSSPNKEAAWRLIEFLAGPDGQAVQVQTGFQVPNQQWLSRTEEFLQPGLRPEHVEVFLQAARYQQAGPPTAAPDNEWWDTLLRSISGAYRGEIAVAEAVRRDRGKIQEALDRAWAVLNN
jgi:multiple sugar transport system substrate-binding protein